MLVKDIRTGTMFEVSNDTIEKAEKIVLEIINEQPKKDFSVVLDGEIDATLEEFIQKVLGL